MHWKKVGRLLTSWITLSATKWTLRCEQPFVLFVLCNYLRTLGFVGAFAKYRASRKGRRVYRQIAERVRILVILRWDTFFGHLLGIFVDLCRKSWV